MSAANAFLGTLNSTEKDTVLFDRGDKTQKQRWSNLPTGLYQRQGLAVGDLTEAKVNTRVSSRTAGPSSSAHRTRRDHRLLSGLGVGLILKSVGAGLLPSL